MQVREILEPQIAALAADKATEEDVQKLEAAVKKMDQSMDDVESFISADHNFHIALAQATQNQLLVNLLDSIVDLLTQQRRTIF
jgi:GntR family transcriptional repressor for pyruvate dehydrogenase complex